MASPQHQGFLKKKGKKRYFVLYDNVVYWFKNEQKVNTILFDSIVSIQASKQVHLTLMLSFADCNDQSFGNQRLP